MYLKKIGATGVGPMMLTLTAVNLPDTRHMNSMYIQGVSKKPNLRSAQKSRPVRIHLGGAITSPQHKTNKQKSKYYFWENGMNAAQSNKELDS
jgi:hypothetical protein